MGKLITVFSLGVLAGIFITFLAIILVVPGRMFVVTESELDFDNTIHALMKSAEANNWVIPHQYNLQSSMKEYGYDTEPVVVMSICNPVYAQRILNSEKSRYVSAIMPCRLAVYEKNGKTYTAMLNARLFYPFINKEVKSNLKAASSESQQILKAINY